jgi:hypothetical protein
MNKNIVMLAVGLALTGAAVAAQPRSADESLPLRAQATAAPALVGLNPYVVKRGLKAVEASEASALGGKVMQRMGGKVIVQSASTQRVTDPEITPGTVVENTLTGQMGYYSGNVLALLKDAKSREAVQSRFGLQLVRVGGDEALVLFRAPAGQDLIKLRDDLRASGLVNEARLDLVEKRYQPM